MWSRNLNMMFLIFFAGFILSVVQCQLPVVKFGPLNNNKIQSHIINGTNATANEYPYQVAVFTFTAPGYGMRCGGSLIQNNWVLSAAHCFFQSNGSLGLSIFLRFGSIFYSSGGVTRDVNITELFIHPMYKLEARINMTGVSPVHDVALIKLLSPVTLSTSIATIQILPKSMTCGSALRTFHASGWGLTWDKTQAGNVSETLMWTKMYEMSSYDCMKNVYGLISATHICSKGNGTQSTCSGDSGGPVVIRGTPHYQVSVNSFGTSSCIAGNPRVQQAVTPYLDWMKYVTGVTL